MSRYDYYDDDVDAINSMRMLAFSVLWAVTVLLGVALWYFAPASLPEVPEATWMWLVVIGTGYVVIDTYFDYRRDRQALRDTARLDAIERFDLLVVPPRGERAFTVITLDAEGKPRDTIGVGGVTARDAIDSALLEIRPPHRRSGDPKEA